ncbi:LytR/AlgR family response regulator transcription factor [Pedobacter vanadiisoli]
MNLRCIVIDDEFEAVEEICEYILNTPELDLVMSFTNPIEALSFIKKNENFDLIFMDVDMPNINGIDLSRLIRSKTKKLIFTTSHAKYALNAFEVSADAFLLKPFNYSKFFATIEKFLSPTDSLVAPDGEYLFIKSKNEDLKLVKVRFKDIVAIESLANYVRIYTKELNLVTHLKLKDAKAIFGKDDNFMQLHRSFLISKNHINSIEGNILTMSNGAKFAIGENFRKIFHDFLSNKTLKPTINK